MINGTLVVDATVHAVNATRENVAPPIQPMADPLLEAFYGLHAMLSPESHRLTPDELLRDWSGEELEGVIFGESAVDVCDYHSLPLDDFFVDGLVRLEKGVEMKRRTPHRVCLHAAVNPLEGPRALEQVEHSIRELGAHGIKIYPARFVQGQTIPVRLDDPEYGIPVIEKAIECGARCIAVHKYFPVGPTRLSAYGVDDVEIAGMFPQINFEVLHPGYAFVGLDGPDAVAEGFAHPPLTDVAKEKMLGENYCRLHGLDVEELKANIADDEWARKRSASTPGEPWASVRDRPIVAAEA